MEREGEWCEMSMLERERASCLTFFRPLVCQIESFVD